MFDVKLTVSFPATWSIVVSNNPTETVTSTRPRLSVSVVTSSNTPNFSSVETYGDKAQHLILSTHCILQ